MFGRQSSDLSESDSFYGELVAEWGVNPRSPSSQLASLSVTQALLRGCSSLN